MKINIRLRKLAAVLLCGVLFASLCINACADEENGDPDTELIAEIDDEVVDDDESPVFTVAFGTHEKMPEGTSAKLTLEAEGGELITSDLFGYSTIALDKYVCTQSTNGGYYPRYGEKVQFKADADKGVIKAHLDIKDSSDTVIRHKDLDVCFIRRDGAIALSDEGYETCEKSLDKPLYRFLLFMNTPAGTVTKIFLIVLLGGGMYCLLHYKDIKRRIRSRKALKLEKKNKGGNA